MSKMCKYKTDEIITGPFSRMKLLRKSSSALLCASFLRTIFLHSHAHDRVHVQKVRDILKAKLDIEINARFSLNEQGDLYFFNYINLV